MDHQEIPLLSSDRNSRPVVDPQEALGYYAKLLGLEAIRSERTCLGCFDAAILEELVKRTGARENPGWLYRNRPERQLYTFSLGGGEVSLLCFEFGAASSATLMEFLIACGTRRFLFFGAAGALQKDLRIGDLVVGEQAIREEGVSYHYLSPSPSIGGSPYVLASLRQACDTLQLPYRQGPTWTTDAIFRETEEKVRRYQAQGVLTVEMEAAALYAVAAFRGVEAGCLFYISDSLADLTWRPGFLEEACRQAIDQGCEALLRAARSEEPPAPEPL
ncbi:MAG: nucleoside phosphorylase [Candidatus Tectomicrobia bacterium]|uniref:Uridine phosphorylase n=1 Tax=Tectimicrobiota bacterium TaxID=2528274 RepID=A0A932CML2_UNCTE|nr:nucleoside phosphorylase [Candidatus Tectomicrobia bacterium]